MNSNLFFTLVAVVGSVLYVLLTYSNRDKAALELAEVWRTYAERMGDQAWVPGRYSWLSIQTSVVHAKLEGMRNGVEYSAEITSWDPEEPGESKDTTFTSTPLWLPEDSGISITHSEVGGSWPFQTPEPIIRTRRLNVYAHPPELARAFETPAGQKVLADFDKLRADCEATGWRKQNRTKHGSAVMFCTLEDWCDDPEQLDAIIDVLTRLCTLKLNASA